MRQQCNTEVGPRKVAIFHSDPETRKTLGEALEQLGHQLVCYGDDGAELTRCATANDQVNLILTGNRLGSIDGVSALLEIAEERNIPAIMVTKQRDLETVERALQDHVMAYLVEPVSVEELKPTIYLVIKRFEQFEELRREVADLQELLETRRHIERAKAVIMRRHDISESEAYSRLRKAAMDNRIKIVETAKEILDADAVSSEGS